MGRGADDQTGLAVATSAGTRFSPLYGRHPRRRRQFLPYSTVETDAQGNRTETWRDAKGRCHRAGDLPALTITSPDGTVITGYYRHGKPHRDGAPASITELAAGTLEEYFQDGKLHRDDGPAQISSADSGARVEVFWHKGERVSSSEIPSRIERKPDGAVVTEYFKDERLHRVGGPALSEVSARGWVREEYHVGGELHRDDGPAVLCTSPDGTVVTENYYRHGVRHRDDGPAHILHRGPGLAPNCYYFLEGQQLTAEEFAARTGAVAPTAASTL